MDHDAPCVARMAAKQVPRFIHLNQRFVQIAASDAMIRRNKISFAVAK
ncbi:MAG: hypothetical protein WBL20_07240 [Sphingobium sp.]